MTEKLDINKSDVTPVQQDVGSLRFAMFFAMKLTQTAGYNVRRYWRYVYQFFGREMCSREIAFRNLQLFCKKIAFIVL